MPGYFATVHGAAPGMIPWPAGSWESPVRTDRHPGTDVRHARRLRTCLVILPGADAEDAFRLAKRLDTHGAEVELLSVAEDDGPAVGIVNGVVIRFLRPHRRRNGAAADRPVWPRLIAFLRRNRYDIVHFHRGA